MDDGGKFFLFNHFEVKMPDHIFDPPRQKKSVPYKGKKDFEFSQSMQDRIQDSRQKNLPPILNIKLEDVNSRQRQKDSCLF
jgi:hypothetical protein